MRQSRTSPAEEALAAYLTDRGYSFEREYAFHPDRKWRADFHLPAYGLLIEVDGITWGSRGRHQTARGFEGDCEKLNSAVALGYRVLRFTPNQIKGTAKRNTKKKEPMAKAIDVIDAVCQSTIRIPR